MPAVAPNDDLRKALQAYLAATGFTKSRAAGELELDPMTLARFVKTGRGLESTRIKLETGLSSAGFWLRNPTPIAPMRADTATINDKVIEALEFLLAAVRRQPK